ncbi:C4-dicarboxylate ABC transporter [Alkaliphilus pronyensis]|uniref:C4-dicarboxylate ABC transporter n=1 Tax=Alkaliphilus pronyensis TaxID=1482732 RepID=A0A6I0EYA9_9FIRM|nr:SLC13 family permease [Alkaliphilus pronyensis]KAB3534430.1 C4-dicarboxylate ABC transporter [Alkaliphilus pronyensis]
MMEFLSNNLDVLSLIVLALAIVISIWKNVNLGTLSLGLALVIGNFIGGISVKDLIAGYPTKLFLMLAGVTFLFGIAQTNGTLNKITMYSVKMVKGKVALLPIVLFFLAFVLASLGPGQVSISALLAAPVMVLAVDVGISPLLMALVVGNGAQAGAMSPLAQNGIVGNSVLAEMGITGMEMSLWMDMLVVHVIVAAVAYVLFGGLKLWKVKDNEKVRALANTKVEPFNYQQLATICGIAILITTVLLFKLDIGFTSFLIGSILILMKAGNEKETFKAIPWSAIMLVTGVTVLVKLMSNIGGMDLFAQIMSNLSTPFTVTLVVGFFAALVSAYASTSGIIMPAFLPLAPLVLNQIGAPPEALPALISTIVVAGHLTDMSPLSTTGAVFISGAPDHIDRRPIYKGMMIWGLSMSVVGALICWILFTLIGIR